MTALDRIADRVRAAAADATPLCIRGSGSKDFYGEVPRGEALLTTELAGITSYEPSELVVTVRAGTPLAELEAALAEHGQCLPFEPPRFESPRFQPPASSAGVGVGVGAGERDEFGARQGHGGVSGEAVGRMVDGTIGGTVGGMVAAGLAGPARASVGSVRDYVLGAQLLNGRGELLNFGGTVMKNVAGYDLSRVLAGSLGIFGLITEVSLKVLPVPPAEATLAFACDQAQALHLLNGWGGQPLPLNASCWRGDGGGTLLLRLRGAVAAVDAACRHLGGERIADDVARAAWLALRDQRAGWFAALGASRAASDAAASAVAGAAAGAASGTAASAAAGPMVGAVAGESAGAAASTAADLWRLSVPQTAPVLSLPGAPPLIEWHGGLRWYAAPGADAPTLREAARKVGGHATLFRSHLAAGAGAAATEPAIPRFDAVSPQLMAVHRALKREFDPAGIFNPGRLYADI